MSGEVYKGKGRVMILCFSPPCWRTFVTICWGCWVSRVGEGEAGIEGQQQGGCLEHNIQPPSVSSLADRMDTLGCFWHRWKFPALDVKGTKWLFHLFPIPWLKWIWKWGRTVGRLDRCAVAGEADFWRQKWNEDNQCFLISDFGKIFDRLLTPL